ncbi:MAG TPA: hypothetical protein PKA41_06395 [Verrucomicrobiota bacterium]|nr:hypothetical protein [Verrucomicrobiota bacterium]
MSMLLLALFVGARAGEPKIDLIEPFLNDQVLIHFEVPANRTYVLQYSEKLLTNGVVGAGWTNLWEAPKLPFANHYVWVDTRLRPQRFYRLHVLE